MKPGDEESEEGIVRGLAEEELAEGGRISINRVQDELDTEKRVRREE